MTREEALAALVDHPHVRRLAELTDESNPDVARRDAYIELAVGLALGTIVTPPPGGPTAGPTPHRSYWPEAERDERLRAARPAPAHPPASSQLEIKEQLATMVASRRRAESCPYREKCGCSMANCSLYNKLVSVPDCEFCQDAGRDRPDAAAAQSP